MPPRPRKPAASAASASPAPKAAPAGSSGHFSALRVEPEVAGLPDPDGRAPAFAHFEVAGVDLAIVNSLRRAIMADVNTAAAVFDEAAGAESRGVAMRFVKNTTVLHNEFLGLRLSLVPINFDENQLHALEVAAAQPGLAAEAATRQYRFVLQVANTGNDVRNVTTADVLALDASGAALSAADRDALFPPSPVSGDHVLVVRLKPRAPGDSRGEELHVEFGAQLGSGSRRGAAFSPVSVCFFRNKVDPAAFEVSLAAKLVRMRAQAADEAEPGRPPAAVDEAAVRRQHAALDGQRDFMRDALGEPAAFEFTLKSESRLRPAYLVFAGFRALVDKVRRFERGLKHQLQQGAAGGGGGDGGDAAVADGARVRVTPVPNVDDFYEVAVQGEDHTLGNMVQAMLFRRWVRDGGAADVSFIGYSQPHPQEDVIVFKVKLARAGDDPRARIVEGLEWLGGQLRALLDEWVRFSLLDKARDSRGNPLLAVKEFVAQRDRSTLAQVVAR